VNVSTDEVYGETSVGRDVGLPESSRLEPTNPYSAAKAGAEMMAAAYFTSYGLPVLTTRGNNVYGPGQFPEKLVPKVGVSGCMNLGVLAVPVSDMIPFVQFTLLAQRGAPLPIHGDGTATRSYLHVSDVVAAFQVILRRGQPGETYNIGSKIERTVMDVAKDIGGAVARASKQSDGSVGTMAAITNVRDRAFNDRRYFVCDEKLAALGWREKMSWEMGLAETVRWYLDRDSCLHWDADAVEAALRPHPIFSNQ
jgi:UDP-glucose 4,6-dehydratase